MILGVGTDLVSIERIARFCDRHGERGLRRVFTPAELEYCLALARPAPSLAARFAAKEAFFKAIGTGVGPGGRWIDAEVVRAGSGRPALRLHGRAALLARRRHVRRVHLSVSHTDDHALAFVILET
jgi:holo-[acyl-carrier protein] synthase